jgi:hypothetical protein
MKYSFEELDKTIGWIVIVVSLVLMTAPGWITLFS